MKIRLLNSGILFSLFLLITFGISCNSVSNNEEVEEQINLLKYVDPFIGTGFHGHTFPGPVMPHAMGFYQVAPGKPIYTIGRPLFDKIEIPLNSEKTFTINTENNSAENKYVQEVYLNNNKRNNLHFSHEELKSGSTLKINMGKNPNKNL